MSRQQVGIEISKFPLKFAKTILIGACRKENQYEKVQNGTMTLLELSSKPIGVTCYHVIECYKRFAAEHTDAVFQVGNAVFDPTTRIIDENGALDLVTLDLTGLNLDSLLRSGLIEANFYCPPQWPPRDVSVGCDVCFGGFPGYFREENGQFEMIAGSFSLDATEITVVNEDYYACVFDRSGWIKVLGDRPDSDRLVPDLGGLSGAPVFAHRAFHFEFVGVIYEHSSFDILYIRPAKFIQEDGRIETLLSPNVLLRRERSNEDSQECENII